MGSNREKSNIEQSQFELIQYATLSQHKSSDLQSANDILLLLVRPIFQILQ